MRRRWPTTGGMDNLLELLAVIASASYGILLARRHGMDMVGVFSVAFIVAFGGGTLRDLFLDRHPLFWIAEPHYPVIVFALAVVSSCVARLPERLEGYLSVPDALGLGLFSVVGSKAALDFGTSYFNAALMGVVTGTFGGVMGDVVCNRVPSLFRPAPLYATASFLGCWLFFALQATPLPESYSAWITIAAIVTLRLLAIRNHWRIPAFPDSDHTPHR